MGRLKLCSQLFVPLVMVMVKAATVPSAMLLAILKAKALFRVMVAPATRLPKASLASVMLMPGVVVLSEAERLFAAAAPMFWKLTL